MRAWRHLGVTARCEAARRYGVRLTGNENGPIAEVPMELTLRRMERRGFDAERSQAAKAAEAQPLTPWLQIA